VKIDSEVKEKEEKTGEGTEAAPEPRSSGRKDNSDTESDLENRTKWKRGNSGGGRKRNYEQTSEKEGKQN